MSRGARRPRRAVTLWPEADGLSVAFGGPGGPGIEGEEAGQAGSIQTFGKPLTARFRHSFILGPSVPYLVLRFPGAGTGRGGPT